MPQEEKIKEIKDILGDELFNKLTPKQIDLMVNTAGKVNVMPEYSNDHFKMTQEEKIREIILKILIDLNDDIGQNTGHLYWECLDEKGRLQHDMDEINKVAEKYHMELKKVLELPSAFERKMDLIDEQVRIMHNKYLLYRKMYNENVKIDPNGFDVIVKMNDYQSRYKALKDLKSLLNDQKEVIAEEISETNYLDKVAHGS